MVVCFATISLLWLKQRSRMEAEATLNKQYQYEVEVGHAKQGSHHVLILKSLKVRDDDLADVIAQLNVALEAVKETFVEGGFTQ